MTMRFRRRFRRERVLILGSGKLGQAILAERRGLERRGYEAVGPIAEPGAGFADLLRDLAPDRIVVALDDRRAHLPVRQLMGAWLRGIPIDRGEEFYERISGRVALESLTPSNLLFHRPFHHRPPGRELRALSVIAAALLLVLTSPLLALVALLIRLDSRGPVFFVQARVGRGNWPFPLFKFRTMHTDADASSQWVRDNGHRITRVGRWLRRYRLDELPQLVNVLRGEMDFVGPRPHPCSNFAALVTVSRNIPECGTEIPYYSLRTLVRPGLTGWAQVHYGYANDFYEEIEKLAYDLYYVKHRSLWLDLRILAETVRVVLGGRGHAQHEGPAPRPVLRQEQDHAA
jgi:lipopolysaccharide/colanic/teichoic acid biosynthesis glycosyltransferase